jgi:CRP/FNR family transcriptional regulator, cyclic AMP receptor protein
MPRVDYFKNSEKFVEYPAEQVIFDQGDPAEEMYAVKEGEVDIIYKGHLLETVMPGQFFGEMSLIDDTARSAKAVAKTDCKIVPVNRHDFLFLMQETPLFALQVMQLMSERLRKMNDLVKN